MHRVRRFQLVLFLLGKQEETRRLELPFWLMAFDGYMLAAQAVDHQLQYKQALLHKATVCEIACTAKAGGRTELLGVLYDELARSDSGLL